MSGDNIKRLADEHASAVAGQQSTGLVPLETLERRRTALHTAIDALQSERDSLLEALRFYASSCDATETTPCGYEGNLCCKTARDAIKASEGKAA
jgi:hypothetical protein